MRIKCAQWRPNIRTRFARVLAFAFVLSAAGSSLAGIYSDSFNTITFRDPASTATWDTATGETRLPDGSAVSPVFVSTIPTASAVELAIVGNILYVAESEAGFKTFDISDPSSPALLASVGTVSHAMQLDVVGDYAYFAARQGGLLIYNISNPAAPYFVAQYDTPDYAYGIDVVGNYAFVGNRTDGLYIIDVSNPAAPTFVSSEPAGFHGRYVQVVGSYAYNAGGSFDVFDISNISNPVRVATLDTPDLAQDLRIVGNFAYVADYAGGFLVIDIANPAAPSLLARVQTSYQAYAIEVVGDTAFILQRGGPLLVFDVSNPTLPVQIATGVASTTGTGLEVAGDYLYAANFTEGVKVHRVFGLSQDGYNIAANRTLSLRVDDGSLAPITRARLSTTQIGTLDWELSANGGASWQSFTPGADWVDFALPGSNLRWRCTLLYQGDGINPTCSNLTIEYDGIDASVDLPVMAEWQGRGWEYGGGNIWYESPNWSFTKVWDNSFQSNVGQVKTWNWQTNAHDRAAAFYDADERLGWNLDSVSADIKCVSSSGGYSDFDLYFCCQEQGDFFNSYALELVIRPDYHRVMLFKYTNGDLAIIAQANASLAYGVIYHVGIDMTTRQVHIAGGSVGLTLSIPDEEYQTGTIGYGVHTAGLETVVGQFDNLVGTWSQPAVSVAGVLTSDCEEPLVGVTVGLVDGAGTLHETVTNPLGAYSFVAVPASSLPGTLSVGPIGGYDFVSPAGGTASVPLTADQIVNFELACVYVTVAATVFSDCLGPMENMTLDLTDPNGGFYTGYTDAAGHIAFSGVRWSAAGGEASIMLPEGFAPVSPLDGHILADLTENAELAFTLACLEPEEDARGMGYWKHQANVYKSGKGSAQESEVDMRTNFPAAIFHRFYENNLNGIDVENVTYRVYEGENLPLDLETVLATLSVKGNGGMLMRAKQHYLALLLNVASHKLESHSIASEDGRTVSQAVQYVASMIKDGDPANDEEAKDIAEALNEGMHVPAGIITDTIPFVPFTVVDVPAAFALSQNFPNPFNPSTTIKLALPEARDYEVAIFDVAGRLVRDFAGYGGPGIVSVTWDGRDVRGTQVSSGIYFYEASAGGESARMKMQLIK